LTINVFARKAWTSELIFKRVPDGELGDGECPTAGVCCVGNVVRPAGDDVLKYSLTTGDL